MAEAYEVELSIKFKDQELSLLIAVIFLLNANYNGP